jgi:NAD(P)-dependent dehydrogenase (short-subunit alcohol dehydrogenase family)
MKWSVEGVRVLITGGTSGLGRAMATALVNAGARVLVGARDERRLRETADALSTVRGLVRTVRLDVRDEASCHHAIGAAVAAFGGLDVLVNNAGIGMRTVNPHFFTEPMPFWSVPPERFRAVVDTNLTGYFLMARAAVPQFLRAGRGKIVNITMNHETMRRRGFVPYGPSRAGAESLSRIMQADLEPYGITVNQLLPGGATLTGMIPDELPADARARLLSPDVMADPICFLCSSASDTVNGARIVAKDFDAWLAEHPLA